MTRILVDSDIILDVLLERKPFYEHSAKILSLCEANEMEGFITPVICANLYYMIRRKVGHSGAKRTLTNLLRFIKVLTQNEQTIVQALESSFNDFEDALQHYASVQQKLINHIITRNTKDYKSSEISVMTPQEFLFSLSGNI